MTHKAKIYHLIDQSTRPSRNLYICASSKKEVSDILGRPLSHLEKYLKLAPPEITKTFCDLKRGEYSTIKHEPLKRTKVKLGRRDIESLASLGYIKAAKITMDQCDLPTIEMKELQQEISGLLSKLHGDLAEFYES